MNKFLVQIELRNRHEIEGIYVGDRENNLEVTNYIIGGQPKDFAVLNLSDGTGIVSVRKGDIVAVHVWKR